MGRAATIRGDRVIARGIADDYTVGHAADLARADRRAKDEERAALLARITQLESDLARSERARAGLRATLTAEREAAAQEARTSAAARSQLCKIISRFDPAWRDAAARDERAVLFDALGCVTPLALHHAHLRLALWAWRRAYDGGRRG